jgi:hypothetical protein
MPAPAQPVERRAVVVQDVEDLDARAEQVMALIAELTELGCAEPAVDCEVPDPATGEVLAIAEACWPEGLQPGQGDPVLLELDPQEADLARLKELDSLRGYVHRRNQEAAGPVAEPTVPLADTSVQDSSPAASPVGASDPEVRAAFEQAMRDVYVRAKKEANYAASYFLTMLSDYGGLGTARRLLASSEVASGFTALYERGRLDLTVEALVLKPDFARLFTDEEVETARQRLAQLGYH